MHVNAFMSGFLEKMADDNAAARARYYQLQANTYYQLRYGPNPQVAEAYLKSLRDRNPEVYEGVMQHLTSAPEPAWVETERMKQSPHYNPEQDTWPSVPERWKGIMPALPAPAPVAPSAPTYGVESSIRDQVRGGGPMDPDNPAFDPRSNYQSAPNYRASKEWAQAQERAQRELGLYAAEQAMPPEDLYPGFGDMWSYGRDAPADKRLGQMSSMLQAPNMDEAAKQYDRLRGGMTYKDYEAAKGMYSKNIPGAKGFIEKMESPEYTQPVTTVNTAGKTGQIPGAQVHKQRQEIKANKGLPPIKPSVHEQWKKGPGRHLRGNV